MGMPLSRHVGAAIATVLGAAAFASAVQAEELTIGTSVEVSSIDPHFHNLTPNNAMSRHFFDRLINQNEKQQLKPGLAVSWEPIEKTLWEFKLRQGVKFHDGSPFTSADVKFTIERAPTVPNSPSSFGLYTKQIAEIIVVDDHTIQFRTPAPYPLMANDISTIPIISKKAAEGASTEDFNSGKAAIGTGPFKFVEFVQGDRIVMEANPDYWGGKPIWDKVTFKPISSDPSRISALLASDVDMIDVVPTTDIKRLKENPKVDLSQGSSNRVIYLHMDQQRDESPFVTDKSGKPMKTNPLKDLRVRQAISKAIHRDAIVAKVMEGVAIPAGQLLPAGFFGVSPDLKPDAYDPEGAKKLLAEAGYPDGFGLTIHGPNDRYINDAKICQAIAQMLTRIGIKTAVETMPKNVYFKAASRGGPDGTPKFSFILVGWGAGSGEASSPLRSLLATHDPDKGWGASNRGRHSNATLDKILEVALKTVEDDSRERLLQAATEVGIGNLGIVPLHYQVNTWGTRKGLKYIPRTDEYTLAMGVVKE